jgi:hypothetical protein
LATKRWIYGLLAAGVRRAIYGGTRAELGTAEIEADTNAIGRVSRETVWILWAVITRTYGTSGLSTRPSTLTDPDDAGRAAVSSVQVCKTPRADSDEYRTQSRRVLPVGVGRCRSEATSTSRTPSANVGRDAAASALGPLEFPVDDAIRDGIFWPPTAGVEFHIRSRMEAKATL